MTTGSPTGLENKIARLPGERRGLPLPLRRGEDAVRRQGRFGEGAGALAPPHPAARRPQGEPALPDRRRGGGAHRLRARGPAPREQPHQDAPAPLQHPPPGRQEPAARPAHDEREVPAGPHRPGRRHRRRGVRGPLFPGEPGPPEHEPGAPALRHPELPRAAQREAPAPLPPVPDPPLRRALRGLDLLGGGIPGDVGGRPALPARPDHRTLVLADPAHARGGRSGTLRGGRPAARQPEAARGAERPPEDGRRRREGPRRVRPLPGGGPRPVAGVPGPGRQGGGPGHVLAVRPAAGGRRGARGSGDEAVLRDGAPAPAPDRGAARLSPNGNWWRSGSARSAAGGSRSTSR